jgi:hypothetical protein
LLRATLKNADAFIDALALKGSALGGETSRLLGLLKTYGPKEVDAALAEATARTAFSVTSVAHLLDTSARKRKHVPAVDVVVPESVRHVHVVPHALADYNALLKRDEEGGES